MEENIFLKCEAHMDGIFTALYEAFIQKSLLKGDYHENIEIVIGEGDTQNLFATEIEVQTDNSKAAKLLEAIKRKLGYAIYDTVFHALCYFDSDRATIVFRYLVRAFAIGSRIAEHLADPYVMRVMELSRKASHECTKLYGFLRFRDAGDYLVAKIAPKCDALPVIVEHFCDRYPNENFLIYDEVRRYTLVHPAYREAFFVSGESMDNPYMQELDKPDVYEKLWRDYFHTMAIQPRENIRCQNQLLPKWYRRNMLEFAAVEFL